MNQARLVKLLKITWTTFWVAAAVSVLTLWARSTVAWDNFHVAYRFVSNSLNGTLTFGIGIFDCESPCGHISIPAGESQKRAGITSILGHNTTAGFGFSHPTNRWIIATPHWFAATLATALAAACWLPYYRFSLRTLLVATTLASFALAALMWSQ